MSNFLEIYTGINCTCIIEIIRLKNKCMLHLWYRHLGFELINLCSDGLLRVVTVNGNLPTLIKIANYNQVTYLYLSPF